MIECAPIVRQAQSSRNVKVDSTTHRCPWKCPWMQMAATRWQQANSAIENAKTDSQKRSVTDSPKTAKTSKSSQEDVNGEKLTVKKWWIFGADFFTVWCRFFHGLRRFFTVCKGHKRWKKNISLLMIFFTVSFSRFAPSRKTGEKMRKRSGCFCCSFFWPFSSGHFRSGHLGFSFVALQGPPTSQIRANRLRAPELSPLFFEERVLGH